MANLLKGWPENKCVALYHNQPSELIVSPAFRKRSRMLKTWRPRGQRYLNPLMPLLVRLGVIDYYDDLVSVRKMVNWLRAISFKPDLILSIPRLIIDVEVSRALGRSLQLPIVWYIHDDWLKKESQWKPPAGRKRFRAPEFLASTDYFRNFLAQGALRLVISEAMRECYRERYQLDFQVFHNPVDIASYPSKIDYHVNLSNRPFLFRYVGALWNNMQMPGFAKICDVIEKLGQDGFSIRLEIYTQNMFRDTVNQYQLHRPPYVNHLGELALEQTPEILRDADGLIINLDFSPAALEISGLSMPTKVSEYMASGTPIFLHGPVDAPHLKYARDESWGWVVSDPSPVVLESEIRSFIRDEDRRKSLGKRGRQLAEERHARIPVSAAFHKLLSDAAVKK